MRPTLERLGLLEFFIAMVTAEDGMETKSQRFLSAAIKMGRPPNHCVVFDSCLAGVTAAHNCTMKVTLLDPTSWFCHHAKLPSTQLPCSPRDLPQGDATHVCLGALHMHKQAPE